MKWLGQSLMVEHKGCGSIQRDREEAYLRNYLFQDGLVVSVLHTIYGSPDIRSIIGLVSSHPVPSCIFRSIHTRALRISVRKHQNPQFLHIALPGTEKKNYSNQLSRIFALLS